MPGCIPARVCIAPRDPAKNLGDEIPLDNLNLVLDDLYTLKCDHAGQVHQSNHPVAFR